MIDYALNLLNKHRHLFTKHKHVLHQRCRSLHLPPAKHIFPNCLQAFKSFIRTDFQHLAMKGTNFLLSTAFIGS